MKKLKFSRVDIESIPFFQKKPQLKKPVIYGSIGILILIGVVVLILVLVKGGESSTVKKLYGVWTNVDGSIVYEFKEDESLTLSSNNTTVNGTYRINGNNLEILLDELPLTCPFALDGDTLSITGSQSGEITKIYRKDSDTFKKVVAAADAAASSSINADSST